MRLKIKGRWFMKRRFVIHRLRKFTQINEIIFGLVDALLQSRGSRIKIIFKKIPKICGNLRNLRIEKTTIHLKIRFNASPNFLASFIV
jgi:hypothetical protein